MLWFLRIVCVVAIVVGWWLFSGSFATSFVDHLGSTSLTCPSSGTFLSPDNMDASNEDLSTMTTSKDYQQAVTRCETVGRDRSNIGLATMLVGVVIIILTALFDPAFKGNRVPKEYRL